MTCIYKKRIGMSQITLLFADGVFITAIRWYKNEELIVDSADEVIPLPDGHMLWENGSLEIFRVQPNDTGIYICEIIRSQPWSSIKQRHAIEVLRKK